MTKSTLRFEDINVGYLCGDRPDLTLYDVTLEFTRVGDFVPWSYVVPCFINRFYFDVLGTIHR